MIKGPLTEARVWLYLLGQAMRSKGFPKPSVTADALFAEFSVRFPRADSGDAGEEFEPHMRPKRELP